MIHGNSSFTPEREFEFDRNEKIYKVEGHIIKEIIRTRNGTKITLLHITGLRFFSKERLASPAYNGLVGEVFSEQFDGYTLGYVAGKASQYIEQLQFFWYRTRDRF